jgi:hypothetical protein
MLVMPIGPSYPHTSTFSPSSPSARGFAPSAWSGSASEVASGTGLPSVEHPASRHTHSRKESAISGTSTLSEATRHSSGVRGPSRSLSIANTLRGSRSTVSVDKAGGAHGSIRVGRASLGSAAGGRRTSVGGGGAGVEAVGVTAAGFLLPASAAEDEAHCRRGIGI